MMRTLETQYLSKINDVTVVGEACDGDQAIKKAQECSPDVIIMDMNLPGASGIAITRKIKERLPNVSIYLCSAYPVEEYRKMNLDLPADGFIQKSCLKNELLLMIRKELDRRNSINS